MHSLYRLMAYPLLAVGLAALLLVAGCQEEPGVPDVPGDPPPGPRVSAGSPLAQLTITENPPMERDVQKSDAEWREQLTPEQYHILREKGTEQAFTGELNKHEGTGTYHCAACDAELFASDTKFDSGTGWPSFYDVANNENVELQRDTSHGMDRTEVLCRRCGGHLGHVFEDGPEPTGLRYCVNSASLAFEPE